MAARRNSLVLTLGLLGSGAFMLGWTLPRAAQPQPRADSQLAPPRSMQQEHARLHRQLQAAIDAGGETGDRASDVQSLMTPHFEEEAAYAMPPLGLLRPLAQNEPLEPAEKQKAMQMADRLRSNYEVMLEEHEAIKEALGALEEAARAEGKIEHAEFAQTLILHAQHEEEVLYPATLLIGTYLKLIEADRPSS